jgi:hypothetical protein
MPEPTAPLTEFIRTYEQATNSHDITQLVPLIAPEAVYWFSDGSHHGREAILAAIAETFATCPLPRMLDRLPPKFDQPPGD